MKNTVYRIYFTQDDFVNHTPYYVTVPMEANEDAAVGMQRVLAMYGIVYAIEVETEEDTRPS